MITAFNLAPNDVMFLTFPTYFCFSYSRLNGYSNPGPIVVYSVAKSYAPPLLKLSNITLDEPVVQVSNILSTNQHEMICDSKLGTDLNVHSCMDALILSLDLQICKDTYKEVLDFEINLPYNRISSGCR